MNHESTKDENTKNARMVVMVLLFFRFVFSSFVLS